MEHRAESKNGVPIYYVLEPHLHSVCIGVYFRCGCVYESKEQNGISHLFEHIVFRNIEKLLDNKLYYELDRHGVYFNASTYKEFLQFRFVCSRDDVGFALKILRLIFSPIVLTEHELRLEKEVVYSEIYDESEDTLLSYNVNKLVWHGTPTAQTILGTKRALRGITLDKIKQYRRELFSTGDMFVCITGCADESVVSSVSELLSEAELTVKEATRLNAVQVPEGFAARENVITIKDGGYTQVMLAFDFFKSEVPTPVEDIMYLYLFSCDSGPFYSRLVDNKGLIYECQCKVERYSNIGSMRISFDVEPSKLETALVEVVDILNRLKDGDMDIELPRRLFKRNSECDLDDPSDLNWNIAFYGNICDGEMSLAEFYRDVLAVTKDDVANAAKKIFKTDRLVLAFRGTRSSFNKARISKLMSELDR